MLVVKNKSSSLLWELNFVFLKYYEKNVIVLTTIMAVMSYRREPRIMQPFIVWVVRKLLPGFPRSLVDEYWQEIWDGGIRCCGVKIYFTKFYLSDVVTCLFLECCL